MLMTPSSSSPDCTPFTGSRYLNIYGIRIPIHASVEMEWAKSAITYLVESGIVEIILCNGSPYIHIDGMYDTAVRFNDVTLDGLMQAISENYWACDEFHQAYSTMKHFRSIPLSLDAPIQVMIRWDTNLDELNEKIERLGDFKIVAPSPFSIKGMQMIHGKNIYPLTYLPDKNADPPTYSLEEAIDDALCNVHTV